MNRERRQAVRDAARYLREVRPVDPDEIYQYVEGRPHPGVVRQVLRESAVELGLRETAEGTFVPVDDEPVHPPFDGVAALPDEHAARLEDLLVDRYGPGWPRGDSGDRLRERIRKLKADYFRQHPVEYEEETALAYAVYHLPDYYAAVQYALDELADRDILGSRLRVLDVGAGVGGPALGVHDYLPDEALVEYHAVEPSAAADVFEALLAAARPTFRTKLHRETAEEFDPREAVADAAGGDGGPDGGGWDLVLFANVLSELDEPVAVARAYCEALAPDGTFLALAPADRNTATGLRAVERELEDAFTVWGPQVRLWPGETPADEGWSFDVRPDLAVPPFQRTLDEAAGSEGEFVNVDVQYAYSVLRRDDERMVDFEPSADRFMPFADSEDHVTQRLDAVAVKLSYDLADGGNPLFKVSDGSEERDHYVVLTRESELNRDLRRADYADLLVFENVLLLWNDDEEAYNLVVDGETVVDRVA